MVMHYHWGCGVGHTYSHPCPGGRKESSRDSDAQTDVEMGPVMQENLPQAGPIPSKNPAINHNNNENNGDEEERGTSDDDSENYDEYDDNDDDYHYRDDDDDEEEGESEDNQSDYSDDSDG
jgi:hypothetical protein